MIIPGKSFASYWFEPFYQIHRLGAININDGLDREGSSMGSRIGLDLFSGINMGFDFRIGKIIMDRIVSGQSEIDSTYMGIYLTYTEMELYDFWGTWYFSASEEYNDSNQTLRGNGFTLGVGFKPFSYFRINMEFSRYTFAELEDAAGNITSTTASFGADELTGSELLFGVSFPIPFEF